MSDALICDLKRLIEIDRALSGYQQLLTTGMESSEETQNAIRWGLEHIDDHFVGIPTISSEAIGDHLKTVAVAVKNAIRKLFEVLLSLWEKANVRLVLLKQKLVSLEKDVAKLEGKPNAPRIELRGIERIAVDGKVDLHSLKPVTDLEKTAKFLYHEFPDYVQFLMEKLIGVQKKHAARYDNLHKEIDGVTPKGLLKHKIHFQEHGEALRIEQGFAASLSSHIKSLGLLPGNRQLTVKAEEVGPRDAPRYDIEVNFTSMPIPVTMPAHMEIPVASPEQLRELVQSLVKLVGYLEDAISSEKRYEKVKEMLLKAIDDLDKEIGDDGLRRGTIHHLQGVAAMTVQPVNRFNIYITETLQTYVAVINRQVSLYA